MHFGMLLHHPNGAPNSLLLTHQTGFFRRLVLLLSTQLYYLEIRQEHWLVHVEY